jgi:hypothetical protein
MERLSTSRAKKIAKMTVNTAAAGTIQNIPGIFPSLSANYRQDYTTTPRKTKTKTISKIAS